MPLARTVMAQSGMTSLKPKKPVLLEHINSWRMHRQYLDRPFDGKNIADLIKAIGWIYTPGGSTPYLAIWARKPSFSLNDLNHLVFPEPKLVQIETNPAAMPMVTKVMPMATA